MQKSHNGNANFLTSGFTKLSKRSADSTELRASNESRYTKQVATIIDNQDYTSDQKMSHSQNNATNAKAVLLSGGL